MARGGLALLAWASLAGGASAATLIHAGRVIDGVSDSVKTNQTVVVDAGKIVAIEAGFRSPAGWIVEPFASWGQGEFGHCCRHDVARAPCQR